jgi:hypothetical protein
VTRSALLSTKGSRASKGMGAWGAGYNVVRNVIGKVAFIKRVEFDQ